MSWADEPPPATDAPPAEGSDASAEEPRSTEEPTPADRAPSPAPKGTAKGRVLDKTTHEGLPAATVQVFGPDGNQSFATELDGTFALQLPPGTYKLVFSTPEYVEQQRTIEVVADQEVALELELAPVVVQGRAETVEVYDTIDTHKASAVLAERRAAATVSDAISSEQIQRSPDSNASDAAKRIVAATIEDNRYVVIRGLGGRYSLTLLNGIVLPSPDPDIPAAPLDLFPAAMITNLTVQKTFSPDLPANFAGGALSIDTRAYPTKFTFKAKIATASDSQSSFRTLNSYQGGSLDLLGFDDGTRALPSAIPGNKLAGDPSLTPEQIAAQSSSFHDIWSLHGTTAKPTLGLTATVGDTFKIDDQRIGYYASAGYGHGYARRLSHIARVGEPDGSGGYLPSVLQLQEDRGIEQANVSAVIAGGWKPRSGHEIDAVAVYTHTADLSASEVTGVDNTTAIVDRTRLQFLQRELAFGQITGQHRLPHELELTWQGNLAHVGQHEPDTRDLLRSQTPDGRFAIGHGSGAAERLFADLDDTTGGGGADLEIPVAQRLRFKVGTALARSDRSYQARRFHFDVFGDSAFLSPEQAFGPGNGANMSMLEVTLPSDGYAASRTVAAGYAMADASPTSKLRLVGGARFELSDLDVGLDSKVDLMIPPMPHVQHRDRDVLPAVNAIYAVTPASNLRVAYAMTVARPNFREIAPALYYDYVRRRAIGGNPDLLETKIHNADVRWETFLGDSEVLAASVFAKQFRDPIEQTVQDAGDGQNVGFANAPRATSYGLELEARLSLGRAAEVLAPFTVGGNLSLIGSRIDLMGASRALQGQSPYVANLDLAWDGARTKTRVDVLYNVFGRRIEEVGTAGAGNVYEEPFHRLDLAVSQELPRNLKLKLAGSNLLDQRVVRTQNGIEILGFQAGVTVVGSLELSVD